MTRRRGRGEVLALILSLAARPDGLTTSELRDRLRLASNSPILTNAAVAGHVFRASRKGLPMRYYATAEAAQAWEALGAVEKPKRVRAKKPKTATEPKAPAVKAKMGAKKPHIPKPAEHQKPPTYTAGPSKKAQATSGEVKGMDTAPRIVAKTPAPRFAPDPGYVGPFSLAGIGRDVQTGRGWA